MASMLLIFSAILHVGWNLLCKKVTPSPSFFIIAFASIAVVFSLINIPYYQYLWGLENDIWLLILGTGLFQALYFLALSAAYARGELSIVYPIVRAIPVIMVPLISLWYFGMLPFSMLAFLGCAMIGLGAMGLCLRQLFALSLNKILVMSLAFSIIAAFGTIGYSMIDGVAIKKFYIHPLTPETHFENALIYIYLQALSTLMWFALYVAFFKSQRKALKQMLSKHGGLCFKAGIMISGSYLLALWSMQYIENVSYVVAVRQLSVPLGIIVGVIVLKEALTKQKLAGMGLIATGLITVALG